MTREEAEQLMKNRDEERLANHYISEMKRELTRYRLKEWQKIGRERMEANKFM